MTLAEKLRKRYPNVQIAYHSNIATLVRVMPEEKGGMTVQLHALFRTAPANIQQHLFTYITTQEALHPSARSYAYRTMQRYPLPPGRLTQCGRYHTLEGLLQEVAQQLGQPLPLHVTWFRRTLTPQQKQISLALYHPQKRLIRVRSDLDHPAVPPSVLRFVLYHEALHYLYPPEPRQRAMAVHHSLFAQHEQASPDYKEAQQWLKHHLFQVFYGRAQ